MVFWQLDAKHKFTALNFISIISLKPVPVFSPALLHWTIKKALQFPKEGNLSSRIKLEVEWKFCIFSIFSILNFLNMLRILDILNILNILGL